MKTVSDIPWPQHISTNWILGLILHIIWDMLLQGSHRPGKIWPWSWKKVPFVLELSWNFVKSSLKIWISLEKYKNTTSPFRFMGCAKKTVRKSQKTEWKSLDTRQRARCNSYSILFNLCGSPGFYHRCQNQRNLVRLLISPLLTEKKCTLKRCVIQNWEEIESLKNGKILE